MSNQLNKDSNMITTLLKLINPALALTFILSSPFSLADSINEQMDNVFNSMINTTTPKTYNSARRGVLSGGQVFIKNPTKRVNLVSATAPSFSAGCGGIDLYGGSFSFINADQMVETFQAIGANALGYGVKLAVQAACESCEQVMTSLEKTAQFINKMNIDSCNAAQGIVDAAADYSTTAKTDVAAKTEGITNGWMTDLSEAWSWASAEGKSATQELKQKDPEFYKKSITGNIAWRAYKTAELQKAFGMADDNKFLELIMTMTGTVIVNNPSTDSESDPKPTIISGHAVSLNEIITGGKSGSYKILKCDSTDEDGCLKVSSAPTQTINDKGLQHRIYNAFTGTNGMINAMINNTEWNDEAKSVLSLPTISGSLCTKKIYESVTHGQGEDIGVNIAQTCSSQMALDAAFTQVVSYIRAARTAVDTVDAKDSQKVAKNEMLKVLSESEQAYREEYNQLSKNVNTANVISVLNSIQFGDGQHNTIIGD